jgi:hypothetical protein
MDGYQREHGNRECSLDIDRDHADTRHQPSSQLTNAGNLSQVLRNC